MKQRIIDLVKSVIKKGAHYVIIGSFVIKFVSFFGSVFLVRLLSKVDYGILSYYENIYGYFLLAAGFGLATGMIRYIVLAQTDSDKKKLYFYSLRRGEVYNFLLIVVFSFVCIFFPHPLEFSSSFLVGIILVMIIPFQYILTLNLSTLRGLFDYKGYAILSVLASAILVFARVIGAALNGLYGTVLLRLLAEIACAVGGITYVYLRYFKRINTKKNSNLIRPLNIYSLQIMFTDGLWAIFMLNDVFMLSQFSGNAAMIADYKIAYVIPANLSLISSAIGIFVAPFFTKKDNDGDFDWVWRNLLKLEVVTLGMMIAAVVFCIILERPLISVLFGSQYLSCIPIYRVLLVSSLFNNGVRYTIANVYSSIGKQKKNLIIAAVGVLSQIIINLVMIPRYGSIGVAYGSVIVQISMSVLLIIGFRDLKKV